MRDQESVHGFQAFVCFIWLLLVASTFETSGMISGVEGAVGVNWGTQASHPLPPHIVVNMLLANNITKVKLFDANPSYVSVFAGTNVEVMVAIPNDMLYGIASSADAADSWVQQNVSQYLFKGGVNIKYVAVGNEPFLKAYNGTFENVTVPALQNIQNSLIKANIGNQVKATVPLNLDVLSASQYPSQGTFRVDILPLMKQLVAVLEQNQAPFTINIYPYLSLQQSASFPRDFAFFDGTAHPVVDGAHTYNNVFDASYDVLVAALSALGFPYISIIVGEIGWPTDGDITANIPSAQLFNQELLKHVFSNVGTPLRPGIPLEVYLFALIDEDGKSIQPGNFERHWGIFTFDGKAKYPLDFTGQQQTLSLMNATGVQYLPSSWCIFNPSGNISKLADNVAYACTYADCTELTYGSSCNSLDGQGNASYAFNSYYQLTNQNQDSCIFEGLAMVTTVDPSTATCKFPIQIVPSVASRQYSMNLLIPIVVLVAQYFWVSRS